MSMLGRPCVCAGSNSNCSRCYGTGVLPRPILKTRGSARRRPAKAEVLPVPTAKIPSTARQPAARTDGHLPPAHVTCPLCGSQVAFDKVGAHVKAAHPASPVRGSKSPKVSRNRRSKKAETNGHEPSHTNQIAEYVFKHLPARWATFGPNYTLTCRRCGQEMNQALLPGHLRDTHGVRDPFEMVRAGGRSSNEPNEAPDGASKPHNAKTSQSRGFHGMGEYFTDILNPRDPLDASKGKHIVRENGRYGSHPLHDRFDDDSKS
jgi:hypothetical protein